MRAGSILRVLLAALASVLPDRGLAQEAPLLHALFQHHAVLQRDQPVRIWGQAPAGQPVRVTLAGRTANARADDTGRWQVRLPARGAGGPYQLQVAAGDASQTVDDLWFGDVWLCSGQSNMELPVWRALDAESEIADAGDERMRLFVVPKAAATQPRQDFAQPSRWQVASPESAREFSAACLFFARELRRHVDVPMGLIQAAWGGSRIEAWISGDALGRVPRLQPALEVLSLQAIDPVAAAAQWGRVWQAWWSARSGTAADDEPWTARVPLGAGWKHAPGELGSWERWGVPELADYDGMVWYHATVELDPDQAAGEASLELGPADETDVTWVNGVAVGSSYGADARRAYPLPVGLLKAGRNDIVLNVLDTWRAGGLAGPVGLHAVRLADGSRMPLQDWHYRIAEGADTPPPAPWQAATGLSTLHNGMIAPLGQYGLRGALWYQGESNTGEAADYAGLLRTLRADWRARFGADLPLLVVQLAGYGLPPERPVESGWAELREVQRQVVAEDPRSALAVAIDIGDHHDIHPPNKQELARRLSRAARHLVYGEALPVSGPVPRAALRSGDSVVVTFADVTGSLRAASADGPIGFELCGPTPGNCRYALATLGGADRVVLHGATREDARVRYCWADGPVCTLRDGADLPAGPFELTLATEESP